MKEKKLKTLKDFEDACTDTIATFGFCNPTTANWLRDVAREWIKSFEKDLAELPETNEAGNLYLEIGVNRIVLLAKIVLFKHFFNLAE